MMSMTETSGDDAAEERMTRLTGKKTLSLKQNENEKEMFTSTVYSIMLFSFQFSTVNESF